VNQSTTSLAPSIVAAIPAAPSADALAHFEALLAHHTDCADVQADLGGVTGWLDEGFALSASNVTASPARDAR
jgi:hypothetical protein